MDDDIVTRLREWHPSGRECEEAADEIERLRKHNCELVKLFQQVGVVAEMWQKSEDELIGLHHDKCADQFAEQHKEIERLRGELESCNQDFDALTKVFRKMREKRDRWRKIADDFYDQVSKTFCWHCGHEWTRNIYVDELAATYRQAVVDAQQVRDDS